MPVGAWGSDPSFCGGSPHTCWQATPRGWGVGGSIAMLPRGIQPQTQTLAVDSFP